MPEESQRRDRTRSAQTRKELEIIPVKEFMVVTSPDDGRKQSCETNRGGQDRRNRNRRGPHETWDKMIEKILKSKGKPWGEEKLELGTRKYKTQIEKLACVKTQLVQIVIKNNKHNA